MNRHRGKNDCCCKGCRHAKEQRRSSKKHHTRFIYVVNEEKVAADRLDYDDPEYPICPSDDEPCWRQLKVSRDLKGIGEDCPEFEKTVVLGKREDPYKFDSSTRIVVPADMKVFFSYWEETDTSEFPREFYVRSPFGLVFIYIGESMPEDLPCEDAEDWKKI